MTATRRRGEELEGAIREAVLAEIAQHGYAGATYEAIATRAGTSKPVLYRRWPSKAEMVLAAAASARSEQLTPPDTGSLAGDVKVLLRTMRSLIEATGRQTLLSLMAELSQPAAESLRVLLVTRGGTVLEPIAQRARERGELGEAPLPPRAISLPFDLVRHELLVIGILSDDALDAIVDDVVVPLLVTLSRQAATPVTD